MNFSTVTKPAVVESITVTLSAQEAARILVVLGSAYPNELQAAMVDGGLTVVEAKACRSEGADALYDTLIEAFGPDVYTSGDVRHLI